MSANLRAFLALLRWCEGTAGEDGYRTRFGGGLFDSFSDHPGGTVTRTLGGKPITSSAAGAYQFLLGTWNEARDALGLPDFSPESQDKAAIFLIKRRGALEDVEAGRLETAISKCANEWASLPGAPYGQPTKTLAQCVEVYQKAGGFLDTAFQPASLKEIVTGKPPAKEKKVDPFTLTALSALLSNIPTLIRAFGKGERSEENAKLAEVIVPMAKNAIGAVNEQELIEKIKSDPEAIATIDKACRENFLTIMEAGGGGITGAREYSLKAADKPLLRQPAFVISLLLLIFPLLLCFDVFIGHPGFYTPEMKTQVITAILVVLSVVGAFWLGSSSSSRTKDEAMSRAIK